MGTCGHGLTSRPRESASEPFLNEPLRFFNYPLGSARALLAGILPLQYCAARFASRAPAWRLLVPGQVASLVIAGSGVVQEVIAEDVDHGVHWVSGSGPGREKNSTKQKTPAHLAGLVVQSRSRVWKRLSHVGTICVSIPDRKRRRRDQDDVGTILLRSGLGWDNSLGLCRPTSPGLHVFSDA